LRDVEPVAVATLEEREREPVWARPCRAETRLSKVTSTTALVLARKKLMANRS